MSYVRAMPPALTVRPAARADMPAVARLAAALVRQHHAFDPRRFLCIEPMEPGYSRWLTRELDNEEAIVLVAEEDGEILGYAYAALVPRDWNSLLDACGTLHDVYVAEEARGRGIGSALVEDVTARLRALGAPRLVLHAAAQNAAAQRLFERLGFRRTMIEMTRELG
jgi:ribosomal protein S18 acetylase RimI-like enzyme